MPRSDTYQTRRAEGTRATERVPLFAHETFTRACSSTGSSRDPSARSSATLPSPGPPRTRRDRTGSAPTSPSGTGRDTDRSALSSGTRLAAGDLQRLVAVAAEHVADHLLWRRTADGCELTRALETIDRGAHRRDPTGRHLHRPKVARELALRASAKPGVRQQPLVVAEETNGAPALLQRLRMHGEPALQLLLRRPEAPPRRRCREREAARGHTGP